MKLRGALVWTVAGALVVLLARTIAYAAAPDPMAQLYVRQAGGPSLPVLALVVLSVGAAVAIAITWLTSVGVRERRLLERRVLATAPPRLRPARIVANAVALWLVAAPIAGLLEATIHWRAGLGWHGLHCLVGPVHRNLIPIIAALSLVAAAAIAAGEHAVAWMRRTFAMVRAVRARLAVAPPLLLPIESHVPRERFRAARAGARAPPAVV
jgi:hypothetical protein